MRGCGPDRVKRGLRGGHFIMALHPPCAVIDIVKLIEALRLDMACTSNGLSGYNTPRKWTRIDACWVPLLRNAVRYGYGLGVSALGQGQVLPAAKAWGVNAFDMAVTDQENLGQSFTRIVGLEAASGLSPGSTNRLQAQPTQILLISSLWSGTASNDGGFLRRRDHTFGQKRQVDRKQCPRCGVSIDESR